ncbi:MAG: hypothetical protein EOL93_02005 [Epsilonproteobacteria bacterium]|nr:hypothetical protein [Campylobacterota bacterium]
MFESIKKIFSSKLDNERALTFDYADEQEHFVGSHFNPFFESVEADILDNLPHYMETSRVVLPYKNAFSDEEPKEDVRWQKGFVLSYPEEESSDGLGLICGVVSEEKAITFISMFPWIDKGQEYTFALEKVYVWSNAHEAHLEVDIGFTTLCFYDMHYTINKKWYIKDTSYTFKILGIAYSASLRKVTEIEVDTSEEVAQFLEIEPGTKRNVQLTGMSMFIPIDSWDRDDYAFSGLITNVEEIVIAFSNQKAWVCSTTILKEVVAEEIEYDIDILITEKVWEEDEAPKVGDDIEGRVWLQGKLTSMPMK